MSGCVSDLNRILEHILKMVFFNSGRILRTNFKHKHIKKTPVFNVAKSLWTDFKSDDFWNHTIYNLCFQLLVFDFSAICEQISKTRMSGCVFDLNRILEHILKMMFSIPVGFREQISNTSISRGLPFSM